MGYLMWFRIREEDFEALKWLDSNVSVQDLILNDATFTSEFILSMSVKNMTYSYRSWIVSRDRSVELFDVWTKPFDRVLVSTLLRDYNVSYLFSTSEQHQLIWGPKCLSYEYVNKSYSPQQYAVILDNYSFLRIVYEKGSSRIYKVDFSG